MKREVSKAIKGTWILTIASLFSELLSAIYRIPLQNIVGDRGYFIYQQVYPIYGIFSVLALSGLPVIISKTFAQQDSLAAKSKLMKVTFVGLLVGSLVLTVMLWISARSLALFMGDPNLYHEIRAVSLTFLLVPFEASFRGYFQSDLEMTPSAISQILEQFIRIVVIIGSAILFGKGFLNIYQMGTIANSGAFIGGLFAAAILMIIYLRQRKTLLEDDKSVNIKVERGLALEVLLIVVFTGITIFYQFIDSFSMLRLLMRGGIPLGQAEILKGVFDRAQPLIQLGIVISLSFVSTIMPQLREANQTSANRTIIQKMMRVCLWLAVAETAGLIALMPEINTMLFTNPDGSVALAIYMVSIMLVSFINLLVAITSGDDEKNLAKLILFGVSLIFKVALNIILIPRANIVGAALATVISECVILVGVYLIYDNGVFLLSRDFIVKLVSVGLFMGVTVKILAVLFSRQVILTRGHSILISLVLIPIGVIIYLGLSKKLNILTKSEWEILPMGKFIAKFMKIEE
ncbi:putative polysaccharide biosynthesis protein [Companilactobacillus hulinensis]|uniref:putative polysaccharide biosynthesis protein n=1 Tax=Companilactobacillus hulinensis TaxID=2486007 RepID=UPI000F775C2A|nr:oligosaccharide flippase family protein [Companilactobacillus hulinensis]